MAAKIASKLDESQAGRQLEALRQPGRRTVLWMSFCQTQSQARFVFDNSIKASFSRRRRFFFFNVCCCVVFFKKKKRYRRHLPALKLIQADGRGGGRGGCQFLKAGDGPVGCQSRAKTLSRQVQRRLEK